MCAGEYAPLGGSECESGDAVAFLRRGAVNLPERLVARIRPSPDTLQGNSKANRSAANGMGSVPFVLRPLCRTLIVTGGSPGRG
jgi:hypothetical protein